jgi:hypothetical protein
MPPIGHNRDLRGGSFLTRMFLSKTQPAQHLEIKFQDFLRVRGLIVGDTKSNG